MATNAAASTTLVSRVLLVLALTVAALLLPGQAPEAAAAGRVRVTLSAPSEAYTGRGAEVRGTVKGLSRGTVRLQVRTGERWRTTQVDHLRSGRFRTDVVMPRRAGDVRVRAVVSRRRGSPTLAVSPTRTIGVRPEVSFTVPATTEVLRPDPEVWSFVAGANPETVVAYVEDPSFRPPAPGGHLVLGPGSGLPAGMFAEVVDTTSQDYGWSLVLVPAPLDEALSDVDINQGGEVVPQVIDARGRSVRDRTVTIDRDGTVTLRPPSRTSSRVKTSAAARRGFGATASAWECTSGGFAKDPADLWEAIAADGPPIEVSFRHTFPTHVFDARSLDLSLSTEVRTSVGFNARAGFGCQLSADFRRNHRLRFPLGTIGPVPVALTLEPMLSFEVSAGGRVEWSQKHTVVTNVSKTGSDPVAGSASVRTSPPEHTVTSDASASIFFGGDLALMLGGGTGPVGAEAGVFGSFGPQLALNQRSDQPGCIYPQGRLRADLGVRLRAWAGAWAENRDFTLASLTTEWRDLVAPLCALPPGAVPQQRARLTWDSGWDVDLHVWDAEGRHTYFADRTAVPGALLLRDVIDGYGPEDFEEDSAHGRGYTYGVCSFSVDEEPWESQYTLEVWDPDGTLRTVRGSLDYLRDADFVTASGAGAAQPSEIPKGWCDAEWLDEPDDFGD